MTDRVEEALRQMIHGQGRMLSRFCCGCLGSAAAAREALLEAFVAARHEKCPPDLAMPAWLIGLARAACARRVCTPDPNPDPLAAALATLKPSLREALLARTVGGLDWQDLARAFGAETTTVLERASRGLVQVRSLLVPGEPVSCQELVRDLCAVAAGDQEAIERHAAHVAGCDACRDLRHEARQLIERLASEAGGAGEDPSELQARLDAATPAATPDAAEVPANPVSEPAPAPRARISPRRAALLVAVPVLGVLAGVGLVMALRAGRSAPKAPLAGASTWQVTRTVRAAADAQPGAFVRQGNAAEVPLAAGAGIAAPGTVRTDERTRVRLEIAGLASAVLDHGTGLELLGNGGLRLREGEVMIVVEDSGRTTGALPVEVAGATVDIKEGKACITRGADLASVRVLRGSVLLRGARGEQPVAAGQEALIARDGAVSVAAALGLGAAAAWSELDTAGAAEADLPGLGELRARRPGDARDRERPLRLAEHKVTVRVLGPVARTEIDETFQNDGGETLEGIYRFPLPADAQIERLALEVDGRLQEGSFVERDRAAAIWRGVIHHAAPKQPKPKEEMIWVPGPWRDPALLEWQRGGRFELRIFPIAPRSGRRVVVAYTQAIPPQGDVRRYVYPLPHAANAASRVDHFQLDARVAGTEPGSAVIARGYPVGVRQEEGATAVALERSAFVPAGDLVIEYRLPGAGSELRAFGFQRRPDEAAYAMLALRPRLPAWTETRPRGHVLVVDSSQSMTGERWARAASVAVGLVAEMDRRDRFALVACDATCRMLGRGWDSPSTQAAAEVREQLGRLRPAGSSDLMAAMRFAASVARGGRDGGREVRVLYIGDAMPSVGPRTPGAIAGELAVLRATDGALTFSAVGIGADADAGVLDAVARVGGGHAVPYRPGERADAVVARAMEASYGVALTDVAVTLPAGLSEISPAAPGTIRDGEELLLHARFSGDVKGMVELSGRVAGKPWSNRYPVELHASTAGGNAFVPRQWAAATIARLELEAGTAGKAHIVELSKTFAVLSRHTSLLVLESPAMMHAFGVEANRVAVDWTGDGELDGFEASGVEKAAGPAVDELKGIGSLGALAGGGLGSGKARGAAAAPMGGRASAAEPAPAAAPPAAKMKKAELAADADASQPMMREEKRDTVLAPARSMPRPGGRWMKKVWTKEARVTGWQPRSWSLALDAAEQALRESPDSRDRHRNLMRALSRAGELERARDVAERWLERDRLDAEALTALADVVARQGDRDESLRLLSGIVDLEPDNKTLHERMARAYERLGALDRACAHRVAMAEISPSDPVAVGAAVRCEREAGWSGGGQVLMRQLTMAGARERAERMASTLPAPPRPSLRGDVLLDAVWERGEDLDVALISPQGTRISWMGGRNSVAADGVRELGGERLALQRVSPGSYQVEISRTTPPSRVPVHGRIRLDALNVHQALPFTLSDDHVVVGTLVVERKWHLEPASGPMPRP